MKNRIVFIFGLSLAFFLNVNISQGQSIITDTLSVRGVCGMCEKRIENAAFIKGVKMAEWNKATQSLVFVYKRKKTNPELVAKAVAAVGHDTELAKAPEAAYKELPDCCAYRDGVEVH